MSETSELDTPVEDDEDDNPFDRLAGVIADGVVGAAGGFAGTALMTGILVLASSLGVFSWEAVATLAQPLGLVDVEQSIALGYLIFLFQGMVPWPLLFASLKAYLPGKRDPVTGAVFASFLWTGFVGAFYTGQTGIALVLYLGLTLIAHWAYGFGLGAVFDYFASRPDTIV